MISYIFKLKEIPSYVQRVGGERRKKKRVGQEGGFGSKKK